MALGIYTSDLRNHAGIKEKCKIQSDVMSEISLAQIELLTKYLRNIAFDKAAAQRADICPPQQ
ncbi:MAG: hypothetical protein ACI96W_002461 [Paraglaciecola sp.]|jgi:hypothetical protein